MVAAVLLDETFRQWEAKRLACCGVGAGLRYDVSHDGGDGFLITTNKDEAINNRLMHCTLAAPGEDHWREVRPIRLFPALLDVWLAPLEVCSESCLCVFCRHWILCLYLR